MAAPFLTIEEVNHLKRHGVAEVPRAEIFTVGEHKPGSGIWTKQDLEDMVRNFNEYSRGDNAPCMVPVGLGHERDQRWVMDTGHPAIGRVTELETDGRTLWGRLADFPQVFAEAVENGSYMKLSPEIYDEPPTGIPAPSGAMLCRVSLLGYAIPANKQLGRVDTRLRRYAERWHCDTGVKRIRLRRTRWAGGAVFTFAEATMDESTKNTLIAVIKGAYPNLPDEFLASLDDEQLKALAATATGGTDPAASTNAEPPSDRAQLIADILAADPSKTQAELEALSDDELKALWVQLLGQPDANAQNPPANPPPKPPAPNTNPNPNPTPGTPTLPPGTPPAVVRAFSEMRKELAATRGEVRRLSATAVKARKAQEAHTFAQQRSTVKADLKRLAEMHAVTPADLDEAGAENEYANLLRLASDPTVHTFGESKEKLTRYQARIAFLETRKGTFRHLFSDRVAAGGGGKAKYEEARQAALARHAARTANASGKPLHERLGQLPARALR